MLRPRETNPMSLAFLYRKELELCKVRPDETIVVVSSLATPAEYIEAAFAAAAEIGCGIYEMKLNAAFSTTHIGGEHVWHTKGAVEAIEAADMVIAHHITLGTEWMARGRAAGTRFLMVLDHPDVLARMQSPPGLKEASVYAREKVAKAKELRVMSRAGTDFRCGLGDLRTVTQWGYADEPGHVDQWGVGHVSTWPNIGSAEGTIVLQPGDAWILPYVRYVEDAVRLDIEKGVIVNVEGKTDAKLIRDFCQAHRKGPEDDTPWHVSHLGWGIHPNAVLDQIAVYGPEIDKLVCTGRAWPGSFLFSTGPNAQAGGTNNTSAHIDLPMFGTTVLLDNEVVIDEGRIVDPGMIVKPTHAMNVAS